MRRERESVAETTLLAVMFTAVGAIAAAFICLVAWSVTTDNMVKNGFFVYGSTIFVVEPMKHVEN